MNKQAQELAWDISEWAEDADLSESNIRWNMEETFFKNGLALPSSIVVNHSQKNELLKQYKPLAPDLNGIVAVDMGFGMMRLKVVYQPYSKDVGYDR